MAPEKRKFNLFEGRPLPVPHCRYCRHWNMPETGYPSTCRLSGELTRVTRISGICGASAKLYEPAPIYENERRSEKWGDDPNL